MRKNMLKVLEAFKDGREAIGDSKRTCWTDGKTIWSYDMPIAQRLFNETSPPTVEVIDREKGPSRTTRAQIAAMWWLKHHHGFALKTVQRLKGHKDHVFRSKAGPSGYQGR